MRGCSHVIGLCLVLGAFTAQVCGDGMIVPTAPSRRVRGGWSVQYHRVEMIVRDQVASVSIDQAFINHGRGVLEVEYLFPIPPGAAIDSMTLVVDGKEMPGKLMDAEEARRIYEGIVRRKKDPALMEYAGFGLYRTRAFPLEPGKPCKVLVHYSHICRKDRDVVEVFYPLNTEKFSERKIAEVKVRVDIKGRADITSVYSPTHDLRIERRGPRRVIATYLEKAALPTEDFQVFFREADEQVGATFLTVHPRSDEDGYFLLLVSPNPRAGRTRAVPKDVVVVLDHSGSMSGRKLRQAKEALRFILDNLNRKDRFNVIAYSSGVEPLFEKLVEVTKANRLDAEQWSDRLGATGGTNIHDALRTAMEQFDGKSRRARRPGYVIFLTDGLPTVGNTKEADILRDTERANEAGARLFAFGVGYDVNVRLLDKLVGGNNGRSDYVKPNEPVEQKITSLYAKIRNPVMTDLEVKLAGVRLRQQYPRRLGDLFAGDQIVLCGRYDDRDAGALPFEDGARHATLSVVGTYLGKPRRFEYAVRVMPPGRMRYPFVEPLWAVRRIGWLLDQIQLNGKSKEVVDELVSLSKKYGILTPYTSFLADESVRLADAAGLRRQATEATRELLRVTKADGQRGAYNRMKMNNNHNLAPLRGRDGRLAQIGNSSQRSYEQGVVELVSNVRQIGNLALFRRGQVWLMPETAKLDPTKDAGKIQRIRRFSEEYFRLIRANNVEQNRLLATQRANEQLLVNFRGQAYMID
jgi:Ca-activated chloride channel family protein